MVTPNNTPQNNPTPAGEGADLPLGTMPISGHSTAQSAPTPPSPGRSTPDQSGTGQVKADQAKGAAEDVAGDAKEAGRAVKDTAVEEAAEVKDDAVREAKRLGNEASTMVESQAADQIDRAAVTVRGFSDDLERIARGDKPEPGLAQDLLDQLGSRADATATWLEDHDPREVLHEVQSFARRRPVAFLAIAAGVGFAAGRLTRGIQQNHTNDTEASSSQQSSGAPARNTPAYGGAAAAPVSGQRGAGAPAYGTGQANPTPGYTGGTDPYAGGGGR